MADSKLLQPVVPHYDTIVQKITSYVGLNSVKNILTSRKGVFGIVALALGYYVLLGRLPADTPAAQVDSAAELFGWMVSIVSALYMGGTALEDALSKGARRIGPGWVIPFADAAGKAHTMYIETGEVDPVTVMRAVIAAADAPTAPAATENVAVDPQPKTT